MSLTASIVVGVLLFQLFQQSNAAQVGRAEAVVARSCDLIRDRYAFYTAGWSGADAVTDRKLEGDLTTVVEVALARQVGVEGGVWQAGQGSLAYAYPTYDGSGRKTDLPAAEAEQIAKVNNRADHEPQAIDSRVHTSRQTLLLRACPLDGPLPDLTAWTMIRVPTAAGVERLQIGVGALLALMVGMSIWLGRMQVTWRRHIGTIETELGRSAADGIPRLSATREKELDRIISALNDAGDRLRKARDETAILSARIARAERLAGLGRVAAGLAHEIRNPLAALRLQGENALAGDDDRRRLAIGEMLAQVARLDELAGELLAMTQRREAQPEKVTLKPFLEHIAWRHRETASARDIALSLDVGSDLDTAVLDPRMVERILDNLIGNAIRHAPEHGRVRVCAEATATMLTISVEDSGVGIPEVLRDHLFEPFVTGRPEGTGLGLAIARELADAHGGRLLLRRAAGEHPGNGAIFTLELPRER